jgi:hypothetical protein
VLSLPEKKAEWWKYLPMGRIPPHLQLHRKKFSGWIPENNFTLSACRSALARG